MENNYKWKKIDKMPSNDKPLLILDSKNKLHILYKEWEERDSFEKWFKLCSEEDVKKWCYFEIDGMNYFDGVLKQNARLQAQLDREIKINRKMKSALEKYATMELEDGVCYDSFTGETFRDGIYDLETGEPPQRLAQQILKQVDNEE